MEHDYKSTRNSYIDSKTGKRVTVKYDPRYDPSSKLYQGNPKQNSDLPSNLYIVTENGQRKVVKHNSKPNNKKETDWSNVDGQDVYSLFLNWRDGKGTSTVNGSNADGLFNLLTTTENDLDRALNMINSYISEMQRLSSYSTNHIPVPPKPISVIGETSIPPKSKSDKTNEATPVFSPKTYTPHVFSSEEPSVDAPIFTLADPVSIYTSPTMSSELFFPRFQMLSIDSDVIPLLASLDKLSKDNPIMQFKTYRDKTPVLPVVSQDRTILTLPVTNPRKLSSLKYKLLEQELTKATKVTAKQIYDFFVANGFSDVHARGIAGNLMHESGGGYINAHGDRGKVVGGSHYLALWNGDRKVRLHRMFGNNANALQQLLFVLWELKNTEKQAYLKLLQTKTVRNATIAFRRWYERPSHHADHSRLRYANFK